MIRIHPLDDVRIRNQVKESFPEMSFNICQGDGDITRVTLMCCWQINRGRFQELLTAVKKVDMGQVIDGLRSPRYVGNEPGVSLSDVSRRRRSEWQLRMVSGEDLDLRKAVTRKKSGRMPFLDCVDWALDHRCSDEGSWVHQSALVRTLLELQMWPEEMDQRKSRVKIKGSGGDDLLDLVPE